MDIKSIFGDPSLTRQKTASESAPYVLPTEDQVWLVEVYEKIVAKMKAQVERVGTTIPYSPHDGHYRDLDRQGGLSFWTNSYWTGILWQMYNATGDEVYRTTAEGIEARMERILDDYEALDHDIGFLFLPMSVANWRKTGNEHARKNGLHAANILVNILF